MAWAAPGWGAGGQLPAATPWGHPGTGRTPARATSGEGRQVLPRWVLGGAATPRSPAVPVGACGRGGQGVCRGARAWGCGAGWDPARGEVGAGSHGAGDPGEPSASFRPRWAPRRGQGGGEGPVPVPLPTGSVGRWGWGRSLTSAASARMCGVQPAPAPAPRQPRAGRRDRAAAAGAPGEGGTVARGPPAQPHSGDTDTVTAQH